MRIAQAGEVWEWCSFDNSTSGTKWEPVLLLEQLGPSKPRDPRDDSNAECYDWMTLDLLSGEVETSYNIPKFGWEKVE